MTITLSLHSSATKDGQRPIIFIIRQFKTKSSISTKCSCREEDFDGSFDMNRGTIVAVSKKLKGAAIINEQINAIYHNIKTVQASLSASGKLNNMTAAEFRDAYMGVRGVEKRTSIPLFQEIYDEFVSHVKSDKTADTYVYAITKLIAFLGAQKVAMLRFDEIDVPFLNKFDAYLSDNGISVGGRRIIFCNIRAVFNYAIKCGYISIGLYPFGQSRFVVKKGLPAKEELPFDVLVSIFNYQAFPGSMREVALDVFKFSLFACGINPIDIYQNIHLEDGKAVFVRQKTKSQNPEKVKLAITPEMKKIVDKYKGDGKNHLFNFHERIRTYMSWYCKIRQELYRVGKEIGHEGLKYYDARYTWSTIAASNDVKADMLCVDKSLGHVPQGMAGRYYINYDWRNTWDAQQKVEEYITNKLAELP